jgi:thiol-disulfide isomerase/thioredoxin
MKRKFLVLTLILLSVIAVLFVIRPTPGPKMTPIGNAVQNFQLVDVNNNHFTLSDLKGSVVFVNFWATWCESCIDEMPSIERLSRSMADSPSFRIVTILYREDLSRAASYLKQNGYTFPVYLNPDESAASIFGITGVPETFIIDKRGVLRDKVLGPAEWDSPQVIASFRALINEPQ